MPGPPIPLPAARPAGLPLAAVAGPPAERADAARNRARILEVAAALVAEHGIDGVSMQDVAAAACVGTGTLYRRFGDRAGLALALLDSDARALQDAMLTGPPPLGPGAPPVERLRAFGRAYLRFLDDHAELMLAAAPSRRPDAGPYPMYAAHLAVLLRAASPGCDAELLAQRLMHTLDAAQHLQLRAGLGWPLERLEAGWDALVDALCAAG